MKKKVLIISILITLSIVIIDNNSNIKTNNIEYQSPNNNQKLFTHCEYSDEYLEWLELPLEERKKIYRPEICKIEDPDKNDYFIPSTYSFSTSVGNTNSTLPEKYDLRNVDGKSYVTNVKNQRESGTCAIFSVMSAIESVYKKSTNLDIDLSEVHAAYSTSYYFKDGINHEGSYQNYPGEAVNEFDDLAAYITNGKGPILESEMDFEDYYNYDREKGLKDYRYLKEINLSEIKNKNVILDVNKIEHYFASKSGVCTQNEKEKIKNYIMNYGGVVASYNSSSEFRKGSYVYNNTSKTLNHAIAIVGWDDTIDPSNFKEDNQPSNPGAWIIKNSWGTTDDCADMDLIISIRKEALVESGLFGSVEEISDDIAIKSLEYDGFIFDYENKLACLPKADNGYYYISYDDILICKDLTFYNELDTELSDNTYYHDYLGFHSSIGSGSNTAYAANVFEKKTKNIEVLNEVTLGTYYPNTNYEIYYSENGSLDNYEKIKSGNIDYMGYTKIKLDEPKIIKNDKFAIIVKYTTEGNYPISVQSEENTTIDFGKSYVSSDGESWYDLANQNNIASIKAHTSNLELDLTTDRYNIDENLMINKIKDKLMFNDFITDFTVNSNVEIKVFKNDTEIDYTKALGTGYKLKTYSNEELRNEYTLIVSGDINGDGQANALDIMYMKRHILGKSTLDNTLFKAGDINESNSVNATDIMFMKRYILGKTNNVWGS